MELVKLLQDAMDRIADPARWIQGAHAQDASGRYLHTGQHPMATAWCSIGSVQRSIDNLAIDNLALGLQSTGLHNQIRLLHKTARSMHFKGIADLNDNGTHEDVMLMFKRAIAQAESAGTF